MRSRKTTRAHAALLGLAALLLAPGTSAHAQTSLDARRLVVAGTAVAATTQPVKGTQHRYFGTLQSFDGNALTIILRGGRLLHVDATDAFASKQVSQPLFRGKPIVTDGVIGANGVLRASAVRRAAGITAQWGRDT